AFPRTTKVAAVGTLAAATTAAVAIPWTVGSRLVRGTTSAIGSIPGMADWALKSAVDMPRQALASISNSMKSSVNWSNSWVNAPQKRAKDEESASRGLLRRIQNAPRNLSRFTLGTLGGTAAAVPALASGLIRGVSSAAGYPVSWKPNLNRFPRWMDSSKNWASTRISKNKPVKGAGFIKGTGRALLNPLKSLARAGLIVSSMAATSVPAALMTTYDATLNRKANGLHVEKSKVTGLRGAASRTYNNWWEPNINRGVTSILFNNEKSGGGALANIKSMPGRVMKKAKKATSSDALRLGRAASKATKHFGQGEMTELIESIIDFFDIDEKHAIAPWLAGPLAKGTGWLLGLEKGSTAPPAAAPAPVPQAEEQKKAA
ncbi:hypothetical protein HOD30_03930, partial [Candidatus Peregrinibacteria bacterium]|nr:hypothetical protein [Candidatus Peregrinibacteria bacterium]